MCSVATEGGLNSIKYLVARIILVLIASACGYAPTAEHPGSQTASPARTDSPSPIRPASSLPSGQWPIYSDTTYKFKISYPPNFAFEPLHGVDGTGIVMTYRAVEPAYMNRPAPGEIDVVIYKYDANDLASWVTKHSGPSTSPDPNRYWSPVTGQANVNVAGRNGFAFVWVTDIGHTTMHSTAALLGGSYVLMVIWSSGAQTYGANVNQYADRMLRDLQM